MKSIEKLISVVAGCLLLIQPETFSQSISMDEQLGKEYSKQIELQMGIINAPLTQEYVDQVGANLLSKVIQPFTFHFQVVDSDMPNAFALPGGYIYVTRGILAIMNSEDELAGVMGHEIMHVLERHSVKQMKKSILPVVLQIPGKVMGVVSQDLENLINTPIKTGSNVLLSSYSRGQESEADRKGIELMSKSGYNPLALAKALENLSKEVELISGEKEKKGYLASHPFTPKRVSDIEKRTKKLEWSVKPGIVGTQLEFYKKLEGLYFGDNPEQGVFKDNQFIHYDLDFTITFPDKWKTENTPTAVGAVEENQRGVIYLGAETEPKEPKEYADEMVEAVQSKHQISPERSEEIKINGLKGYVITYMDDSEGETACIHSLWLKIGAITYQVIGMGYEDQREAMRETAMSIRRLNNEEKNSVFGYKLKAVTAKSGENIMQLSQRTGNTWNVSFTSITNDIPEDMVFEEGYPVKIVIKEQYKGRNK